jgi:hypothetical protein
MAHGGSSSCLGSLRMLVFGMSATRITRHMNAPRAALVERDL